MDRVRLGMVGGGQGAFIGAVHRIAARLDDAYTLVCGALSSDPERARNSGAELGLDPARCYDSYAAMFAAERARADGMEVVAIVTPNHLHHPIASAALDAGFHVICDKPLATSVAEAEELVQRAAAMQTHFRRHLQLLRLSDGAAGTRDGGARRHRRAARRAGGVRARLAGRTAGGHRAEAGGLADRSGAVGTGRCDRRYRQPRVPSCLLRHRSRAASQVLAISPPSWPAAASMTTLMCCCASRAVRVACCGRARSRTGTRMR